mmetsp:Transcript_70000/g.154823  ORF Transcript_70000/g.154823 Transcript_70000/m.154823 type:complete len:249 (-) Transcript_70000:439-1185(-)
MRNCTVPPCRSISNSQPAFGMILWRFWRFSRTSADFCSKAAEARSMASAAASSHCSWPVPPSPTAAASESSPLTSPLRLCPAAASLGGASPLSSPPSAAAAGADSEPSPPRRRQAACKARRASRPFSRRRCCSKDSMRPCKRTSSSWISRVDATRAATSRFSCAVVTPGGRGMRAALRPCNISWKDARFVCAAASGAALALPGTARRGARSVRCWSSTSLISQRAASRETVAKTGSTRAELSWPRVGR